MNPFQHNTVQPIPAFAALLLCLQAVLLSLGGAFSPAALAFTYQPDASITIDAEYDGPPGHSSSTASKTWIIRSIDGEGAGASVWDIYPAGSDVPFCSIVISAGSPGRITMAEKQNGRIRASDSGLFILPGYPAPCNVLPVDQAEPEKFYTQKRSAGGRVFVKRYRVFWESIPWATALDKGWLKTDDPQGKAVNTGNKPADSPPGQQHLRMLTVADDTEKPVVRQLWREGETWWIYEETPSRRSWRVK